MLLLWVDTDLNVGGHKSETRHDVIDLNFNWIYLHNIFDLLIGSPGGNSNGEGSVLKTAKATQLNAIKEDLEAESQLLKVNLNSWY